MRANLNSFTVILCAIALTMSGCYRPTADQRRLRSDIASNAININTATTEELTTIPNIGEKLAERIVEFRETNGRFERPEDLLLVPGISDKRFRDIRSMIKTE